MAEGLNRVILLGNLGADPELRVTPGGQAVLKLRLATNESYVDKNNVRQERTEWHRVTVWGRRAEALGKFLQKGDSLFIEGRLQTSSYEKNGEKRYSTEIVANNIILSGGRGRAEGAGRAAARAAAPVAQRDGRRGRGREAAAAARTRPRSTTSTRAAERGRLAAAAQPAAGTTTSRSEWAAPAIGRPCGADGVGTRLPGPP